MHTEVVVWNLDARNRPELEVEMQLEFELIAIDDLDDALDVLDDLVHTDAWFVDDGAPIVDDLQVIYSAPPHGYAHAYAAAS